MIMLLFKAFVTLIILGNISPNNAQEVKISNWGKVLFILPEGYWSNKEKEILEQVKKEEFEQIKKFSHYSNIPCQMLIFCDGVKTDTSILYTKQRQLKIYRVATFTHINNTGENRGEWAIVSVPYSENKSWDNNAKWDTVYFIVNNNYVQPMN